MECSDWDVLVLKSKFVDLSNQGLIKNSKDKQKYWRKFAEMIAAFDFKEEKDSSQSCESI